MGIKGSEILALKQFQRHLESLNEWEQGNVGLPSTSDPRLSAGAEEARWCLMHWRSNTCSIVSIPSLAHTPHQA